MKKMKAEELASILIKETLHSFKIGDEFTSDLICDLAYHQKVQKEITPKRMKKKISGFIGGKMKSKIQVVEKVDGVKEGRYQVYKKIENVMQYKTLAIDPIPDEYYDFVFIWNELEFGESVTAEEFLEKLEENEIDRTYTGQSSKFLWIIADRGLADCVEDRNPDRNLYTRLDSIPEDVLGQEGTKFLKFPIGIYQSQLNSLPL